MAIQFSNETKTSKKEKIIIKKYHEDIWKNNKNIQKIFNDYFDQEEIKRIDQSFQSTGMALSTVGLNNSWILNNDDLGPLIQWIDQEIHNAAEEFFQKQYKNIYWSRVWSNKMYKNSSVKWHVHGGADLVAVFYLNVPDNGAKLITKNSEFVTQTGDLVIHEGFLEHSVSEHLVEEPRIVIIFETKLYD